MAERKFIRLRAEDQAILTKLQDLLGGPLTPVSRFDWNTRGYVVNEAGAVTGLGLSGFDIDQKKFRMLAGILTLLGNLTELNLSDNELTDLSGLGELTNLTELHLNNNQLTDLSVLAELTNLTTLDLSFNQITDLSGLAELTNLAQLNLNRNQLTDISAVKDLRKLTIIKLQMNQLSDISSLENLTNLTKLWLSENRIKNLSALQYLKQLNFLWLWGNQISDISSLKNLKRLKEIGLSSNQIQELPAWITEFDLDILYDGGGNDGKIHIGNNPLKSPPVGVVKSGREAIRNYFKQIQEQGGADIIEEARLLIVGEPKSGKTTLLKKILNPSHRVPDPSQEETLGVTIYPHEGFPEVEPLRQVFTTHIWDFGGQTIQYHIHQFFLADRSLYVLMLDDRKECPTLDYWFNIIKILGEGSPVLVVLNRINKTAVSSFDFKKYQGRYPELTMEQMAVDFSQNNHHFESLIQQIQTMILSLPHLHEQLPASWPKVRAVLASKAYRDKKTIGWNEFQAICRQFKVESEEDQLTLSGYFHSLGLIQHFRKDSALFETVFLNPEWLTRAVYTILSDPAIPENKGSFTREWLFDRWGADYSVDEKNKLLQLMQKKEFDLCYSYQQNGQEHYLTPDLMPNIEPDDAKGWEKLDQLSFRYQYPFMPQGLIGRLIVRLNSYIDKDEEGKQLVWKSGSILKKDGVQALIMENLTKKGEKVIEIHTRGGQKYHRREFLTQIRGQLETIHEEYFPNLNVHSQIPCICDTCRTSSEPHPFPFVNLIRALEKKKLTMECGISLDDVSVERLSGEYLLPDDIAEIQHNIEYHTQNIYGEHARGFQARKTRDHNESS